MTRRKRFSVALPASWTAALVSLVVAPASLLAAPDAAQVVGDLQVDGIHFSADGSVQTKASPWNFNSNDMYVLMNGSKVGINTMTPTADLEVVGTIKATQFVGNIAGLAGWGLNGNAGTVAGTNFIGTTDNQALEIKVNNMRAIRIEPTGNAPNITSGHSSNLAGGGYGQYGAVVSGGSSNTASGNFSAVGGGDANMASGTVSAVGGGYGNTALGDYSYVGGGYQNTASGKYSTVCGGVYNRAGGSYSFAGGYSAVVRDKATVGNDSGDYGSFLWADYNIGGLDFTSYTANEFAARATGGVRFVTAVNATTGTPTRTFRIAPDGAVTIPVDNTSPNLNLSSSVTGDYARLRFSPKGLVYWDVAAGDSGKQFNIFRSDKGNVISITPESATNLIWMSNGAHLTTGGAWTNASDRNLKTGFEPVDPHSVLAKVAALPITTWSYKSENSDVRHLGPMAQDFHAAFGLGGDDRSITTVDATGVALAAIQALKAENDALKERLERMEKLLSTIVP